ncbi:hypothetical protein Goari_016828, partial [Gossypium aridum]|nr:hypothetical protein [Gossypium aridum]
VGRHTRVRLGGLLILEEFFQGYFKVLLVFALEKVMKRCAKASTRNNRVSVCSLRILMVR